MKAERNQIERNRFGFLQLFAEAAGAPAGGDTGAGGATGQPAPASTGAPASAAAPAAGGQAVAQPGAQGAPGGQGETWTPEKDQAFAKRLEAERAKIRAQEKAEFEKQYGSHIKLGEAFRAQGYDPNQILTEWERQALETQAQQAGVNPQVLQTINQLQNQVQTLTQERQIGALNAEVKALEADPVFSAVLATHGQAAVNRAAKSGESLKQALFALAGDEILKARDAATEQAVLARVTGRDGKAPINATGGPQVTPSNDVKGMSKADFEKLKADVKAGRRTTL